MRFPALDISRIFSLFSGLIHSCSCESSTGQMYVSSPNLSSELQAHMPNFLLDSPLNFSQELDTFKTEFSIPLRSHFSKCSQQFQTKTKQTLSCTLSYVRFISKCWYLCLLVHLFLYLPAPLSELSTFLPKYFISISFLIF